MAHLPPRMRLGILALKEKEVMLRARKDAAAAAAAAAWDELRALLVAGGGGAAGPVRAIAAERAAADAADVARGEWIRVLEDLEREDRELREERLREAAHERLEAERRRPPPLPPLPPLGAMARAMGFRDAAPHAAPLQFLTDANNVGYIDVPVDYKDGITLGEFEENDPVIEIIVPNRGRVHKYFYNPESIEGWFRQQIEYRRANFTIPEGNQIIATIDGMLGAGIVINRGFVRISNPLNSINNSLFNGGRRRKTRRARRSRKVNRYRY